MNRNRLHTVPLTVHPDARAAMRKVKEAGAAVHEASNPRWRRQRKAAAL